MQLPTHTVKPSAPQPVVKHAHGASNNIKPSKVQNWNPVAGSMQQSVNAVVQVAVIASVTAPTSDDIQEPTDAEASHEKRRQVVRAMLVDWGDRFA